MCGLLDIDLGSLGTSLEKTLLKTRKEGHANSELKLKVGVRYRLRFKRLRRKLPYALALDDLWIQVKMP